MASEPMKVPVPICELCWLIDHTSWEPESMDENGKVVMRLSGIEIPQKYNTDAIELCSICGGITISGIYLFEEPEIVDYVDEEDEEDEDDDDDDEYDEATSFIVNLNDPYDKETDSEK